MRLILNAIRSRIALLGGPGLGGLGLAMLGMWSLWQVHTHPDLRDKVSHIHRGMTRQDVHKLLGGPPGDYRTVPEPRTYCHNGPPTEEWHFDDGNVMVTFLKRFDGKPQTCFEVFYAEPGARFQPAAPPFIYRLFSRLGF
jgi:hypothetical protein